jgi:peptide/nickel transport system permease protein
MPGVAGFALFLGRRLLGIAILAWAVTVVAFAMFRVAVVGELADVEINAQLGAGEPAWVQYFHYLLHLLHGNLGATETVGLSVDELLWRALPPTLSLVIGGMALWLAAGVVAGLASGLRPGSLADRVITALSSVAVIVPVFLLALVLLGVFSYTHFLWIQPGYAPLSQGVGRWLGRMVMPWIALAAAQAGLTARLTRASVIEASAEDYIRTAQAKGLSRQRIAWMHVLRSSAVPVLASLSVGLGTLLGSAAIIDQIFALDGIGQALLTAVKDNDLMVIMGTILLTVILISLASLLLDLCQALIDPRVLR